VNASLAGKSYPPVVFEVNDTRVRAFADVVDAPGADVPPTFATVAEFLSFPSIISDPELGLDFSRVIHGEQEYVWYRPLMIGDKLTARSTLASIRQRGGVAFLTIETELRDGDSLVVTARATLVERAPT
jgi:MaoC dehydratase-like protein